MKVRLARTLFLIGCFFSPSFLSAAVTAWRGNPHGRVRIIVPYSVAPNHGSIILGVEFEAAPGWHLYWKDPGDAGMSPRFTWEGSSGFSQPETLWPAPHYYVLPGNLKANGYEGEVIYPVRVQLARGASALHIVGHIYYLTCAESCIPYRYTFTLDLPTGAAPVIDGPTSSRIAHYLAMVPPGDRQGTPAPAVAPMPPPPPAPRLGVMILVGFLGGLILNVMPCVLPVLAIKLFGLLQNSGKSRARSVLEALASAGGIVFSYLALGAVVLVLRRTGHAVGWGIQFQQPIFVGAMAVIVFAFALNLWGVFEINLPQVFGNFAVSQGRGESVPAYFVSGLFATLLATPCSAPFLGTAMGFALAQPAPIVISIFLSAGVGMAFPYLALAVFPGSLGWLPKPGAWMNSLRRFFGLLLAGTGLWLLSVLYMQLYHSRTVDAPTAETLAWTRFDEGSIAGDLKEGKAVFVDVTAAWCFTCKYNERFVLSLPRVVAALRQPGIVLMRADWTNPDPAIDHFLKRYGRAGIPFYIFLRPGHPPVLLSELLTEKAVLHALE